MQMCVCKCMWKCVTWIYVFTQYESPKPPHTFKITLTQYIWTTFETIFSHKLLDIMVRIWQRYIRNIVRLCKWNQSQRANRALFWHRSALFKLAASFPQRFSLLTTGTAKTRALNSDSSKHCLLEVSQGCVGGGVWFLLVDHVWRPDNCCCCIIFSALWTRMKWFRFMESASVVQFYIKIVCRIILGTALVSLSQ